MAQLGAEYPSPVELFKFLDRTRVGAAYIRATANMIRAKYPASWPKMRARFVELHREEIAREEKQRGW